MLTLWQCSRCDQSWRLPCRSGRGWWSARPAAEASGSQHPSLKPKSINKPLCQIQAPRSRGCWGAEAHQNIFRGCAPPRIVMNPQTLVKCVEKVVNFKWGPFVCYCYCFWFVGACQHPKSRIRSQGLSQVKGEASTSIYADWVNGNLF